MNPMRLLPLLAALLGAAPATAATTAYVSETLEAGVYRIQAADPKMLIRKVKGGDPLEAVKREGEWVQVREPGGELGWIEADRIMQERPARMRVVELEAERAELRRQLDEAERRIHNLAGAEGGHGMAAVEQNLLDAQAENRHLREQMERAAAVLRGEELPAAGEAAEAGGWERWLWPAVIFAVGFVGGMLFFRHRHCRQHGGFRITLG